MRLTLRTAVLLLAPVALRSQQPKPTVDYHKADLIRVSSDYVTGTVARFGGFTWLEDSVRFWYQSTAKNDRNVVYLVDPRTASRRMLFDNARLAASLSVTADTILDPTKLPRFKVVDTARAVEFALLKKKPWRCDVATYKCVALA